MVRVCDNCGRSEPDVEINFSFPSMDICEACWDEVTPGMPGTDKNTGNAGEREEK
jgi:hypothetical protein